MRTYWLEKGRKGDGQMGGWWVKKGQFSIAWCRTVDEAREVEEALLHKEQCDEIL